MKLRVFITSVFFCHASLGLCSESWGPEIIEFDLEGGEKIQTMLWISGYSYSTTELLHSAGCLELDDYIGSEELILALNHSFKDKKISAEMAADRLGDYIRSNYACAAYNKKMYPIVDVSVE